ncbi:MAG: SiaB family protein kinase [Brumimicrobium sp.]|nr:SiaB family protein kinase [Brumimicrobium sp.]
MDKGVEIKSELEEIYRDLHNRLATREKGVIILSHHGEFSQDLINSLSEGLEQIMITNNAPKKIIKRVFSIMIEGLQNIRIHGAKSDEGEQLGHVIVANKSGSYTISFGNLMEEKKQKFITEYIDKLNGMNEAEVKAYYMEVLGNGVLSEKGGAGLGFITMCLKSKSKLAYQFFNLENSKLYFEVHMTLGLE